MPEASHGGRTAYQLMGVAGVDTSGSCNHYSALRTFEDLVGIKSGGADGYGHLGFAATASDFGADVFNAR